MWVDDGVGVGVGVSGGVDVSVVMLGSVGVIALHE